VDHGYKGKGSLIHLLSDINGKPLAATTTAASGNERKELGKLTNRINSFIAKILSQQMIVVEADKGYDAGWLRQELLGQGFFPLIPYRKIKGRKSPSTEEICKTFHLTKGRWVIERTFSWLKRRYRRLMLRWERQAAIWSAFVTLSLIGFWVRSLFG